MTEPPILEIRGVRKSFGGLVAVRDLSLTLRAGRVTGLVGPNGAGKTTLFNLISGFLDPDSGEVFFASRRISGVAPHQIAKLGIGRTFQDIRIFSGLTALDNVLAAIPGQPGEALVRSLVSPRAVAKAIRANRERAFAQLEFVGLADFRDELAQNLSFGQQKRLALARLLAADSKLLLLDEPAAGLDPSSVDSMVELIRALVPMGKTVCLIEHNLDLVESLCDWLLFLDQGTLIAEGHPADITARADLADVYFGHVRGTVPSEAH